MENHLVSRHPQKPQVPKHLQAAVSPIPHLHLHGL